MTNQKNRRAPKNDFLKRKTTSKKMKWKTTSKKNGRRPQPQFKKSTLIGADIIVNETSSHTKFCR
jgi:hypothetical protein